MGGEVAGWRGGWMSGWLGGWVVVGGWVRRLGKSLRRRVDGWVIHSRCIDGRLDGDLPKTKHATQNNNFPFRSMVRPRAGVGQDHVRTEEINGTDRDKAAVEHGLQGQKYSFGVDLNPIIMLPAWYTLEKKQAVGCAIFTDSTWSRDSRLVYASLSGTTVCPRDCCDATASRVSGTPVVSS